MIIKIDGSIIGVKVGKPPESIDIMSTGGIGYRVFITASSRFKNLTVDSEISLYTSFQVREESQTLYGFSSEGERDFFETLLSVSGIGPKIALSMLSLYNVDEVKKLILDSDHSALSKTVGLGPKGAKKIILELSGVLSLDDEKSVVDNEKEVLKDLKGALKALGYTSSDQLPMIESAHEILQQYPDISVESLLQSILKGD